MIGPESSRPSPVEAIERPLAPAPDVGADSVADPTGPGPLGRRFFRPETIVSFAIALAILVFFFRRLDLEPAKIWALIRHVNPWLYAMAFVVWYGGFWLRGERWIKMLGQAGVDAEHGYRLPSLNGIVEILLLSWFANCVVPAKLGDAYRAFLLKQESGVPFSKAIGTILSERLADLAVLCLMMAGVAVALFHGHVPAQATQTFILGGALILIAAVGLGVMWAARDTLHRLAPARFRGHYANLHEAVFGSLRRPDWVVGPGIVLWLIEGLRFWFVGAALHSGMSLTVALFIALMGALLTTLPLTPAGLGVVEAGTGAVMVHVFGMDPTLAVSIILLDRVCAYWALVGVGLVLYVRRFRRLARLAPSAPTPHPAGLRQAD
ncbi:MAG TPA: lysylphosphatidylglycerol synthase transmembrane domain-containing protein [Thermomicrobiales bacterium]|nr:lysylphosphatidylglycerol synthase transmembrane domain-containing protein [Thermomicrobiales bacterium]